MTLRELAAAVGVDERQIRFLIAEGFVPKARGTGQTADPYDDEHLQKALRYKALYDLGFRAAAIKLLMEFDEGIPVFQDGGIEVRVLPSMRLSDLDVEKSLDGIREALNRYVGRGAREDR